MSSTTKSPSVVQFRQEWRANSRLRYGVYLVVGIVWVYGILLVRDQAEIARSAWQAVEFRNVRARETANSADWLTRAQDVTSSIGDYEQLLWREGSIGLSQASFQERVTQSFSAAGLVVRSVRVAAATDASVSNELAEIVPLRARAQVEFRPASFYPWLASIGATRAEKRPTMSIESLTIRIGSFGQPSIADIELIGFALKSGAQSAPKSDGTSNLRTPATLKRDDPK